MTSVHQGLSQAGAREEPGYEVDLPAVRIYHSDGDKVNITVHQSSARSETARDTKMSVQSVYEQHLIQEHEIKMRIMKKKEELIDLKLGYYRQKIAREFHK